MNNTRPLAVPATLLVALLPSLLFLSSCDFNKTEPEKEFENPLAHVGKMHNQGVDHVLGDIKETDIKETDIRETDMTKKRGRNVLSDVIKTSAQAFLEESDLGPEAIKTMKVGMSAVRSTRSTDLRKSNDEVLRVLPDSLRGDLSEKQREYLREVGRVVLDEPPMPQLKKQVNKLGRSARDELSREDAMPVFAAIALAKSSSRYWRDNLDEWRRTVLEALPEADSTVVMNKDGETSKDTCSCKKT